MTKKGPRISPTLSRKLREDSWIRGPLIRVYVPADLEYGATPRKQVEDQHNGRHDEQQVNEPTANAADEPDEPQHQKNREDSPKHNVTPLSLFRAQGAILVGARNHQLQGADAEYMSNDCATENRPVFPENGLQRGVGAYGNRSLGWTDIGML